jgi:DNA-binding CsgD family transcriptional regulator
LIDHALIEVGRNPMNRLDATFPDWLAQALAAKYGVTAAEADVAIQIGKGESLKSIAHDRGSTVGTVRTQLKRTMRKMGVNRQAQLVRRVMLLAGDKGNA